MIATFLSLNLNFLRFDEKIGVLATQVPKQISKFWSDGTKEITGKGSSPKKDSDYLVIDKKMAGTRIWTSSTAKHIISSVRGLNDQYLKWIKIYKLKNGFYAKKFDGHLESGLCNFLCPSSEFAND